MKHSILSKSAVSLITLSLLTAACDYGSSNEFEAQIDELFSEWDSPNSPGAAVGVVQNGKLTFKKGYGMANLDYNIPITPTSVFDIASVSKQFCAMAIAILADRGELSLDDNIQKHIPEVPDFGYLITIRNLVHHTSGIRDWPATLALGGWQMDDIISFDQILRFVENQKDLNFQPGAEYTYSNTGYNLLAETVARVTGQSFSDWTKENIFDPLGMEDTHFHDDHQVVVKNRVTGYFEEDGKYKSRPNGLMALGSSSLYTTIEDMAKWAGNFESGEVGGSEVMEMVNQRGVLNNGDTVSYAFGHGIGEYRGLQRIQHSGSWAGFRTFLVRFPEQKLSVIVLSNFGGFNPSGKAYEVANLFLSLPDEEVPEESSQSTPNSYEKVSIEAEIFDSYAGDYELEPGFILTFTREEDRFYAQATGQNKVEIFPSSDSTFFNEDVGASVTFHRNAEDTVLRMTLHQGGDYGAPRIIPLRLTARDLAEYCGLYYSSELKTFYEFSIQDESLVASHHRHGNISLNPIRKNRISSDTWFFNPVIVERDHNDQITGLRIGSGRMRNVHFVKLEDGDFEKY